MGQAGWPLPASELARWRKRVDGDAREFLQLCNECRCVPDVWSLHEWSNWLTPTIPAMPNRRRYDTAFFICCLDHIPPAARDDREIVKAQSLVDLHHFSRERGAKGCERWLPVVFPCEDGQVSALPGDDLYPTRDDPEVLQGRHLSSTVAELRQSASRLHRSEILPGSGLPAWETRCNITPKFGHLSPMQNVFQFVERIQSKL
ncbi:acyl-coenzyme A diphosphatase NUDT19-like isoform X3 [Branchiostoma floridae x Branchiostoma belcheri]